MSITVSKVDAAVCGRYDHGLEAWSLFLADLLGNEAVKTNLGYAVLWENNVDGERPYFVFRVGDWNGLHYFKKVGYATGSRTLWAGPLVEVQLVGMQYQWKELP
ncbi:hypothetical protein [Mycolicibacterium phlei]|uniref:hypothetical protein n=1 Tax=Mycolicibacterium phlei TaxID=1771 RepID=UPI001039ADDB|nr:hypothetical protein [Mycolicibacterium phlei]